LEPYDLAYTEPALSTLIPNLAVYQALTDLSLDQPDLLLQLQVPLQQSLDVGTMAHPSEPVLLPQLKWTTARTSPAEPRAFNVCPIS